MKIQLEARAKRGAPILQELEGRSILIGTAADCDFVVAGDGFEFSHVADQHAKILITSKGATLEDLGSPKGTWLNGRSLQQPIAIRQGSKFLLGRLGPAVTVHALDLTEPIVEADVPTDVAGDKRSRLSSKPMMVVLGLLLVGLIAAGFALQNGFFNQVNPGQYVGGDGDHFALIIAVEDYPEAQPLADLEYVQSDAEKLAASLHERGFDVTLMVQSLKSDAHLQSLQPTAANIRRKLRAVLGENRKLDGSDAVVVALIGHSVQFETSDGRTTNESFFFCPADADVRGVNTLGHVSAENNLISLAEIYSELEMAKDANVRLVYLDTARTNRSRAVDTESVHVKTLPSLPRPPAGVSALLCCNAGEQCQIDSRLPGSACLHFFAQGLQGKANSETDPDRLLTLAEIAEYVAKNTTQHVFSYLDGARQQPYLNGRENGESALAYLDDSTGASSRRPGQVAATGTSNGSPQSPPSEPSPQPPLTPEEKLAADAYLILKRNCADCHDGPSEDYSLTAILSHSHLLAGEDDDTRFVVAGNLDDSYLWERVSSDDVDVRMPPEDRDPLSAKDRDLLKRWILDGAHPFPDRITAPPATPQASSFRVAQGAAELKLAGEARDFLTQFCKRCHESGGNETKLAGALDPKVLLSEGNNGHYISPGNPDESRIWSVLERGTMPKSGPKPDDRQKTRFREWIAAGAPDWGKEVLREPVQLSQVLRAIADDLRSANGKDRRYLRYFTLDHLHNNSFGNRQKGSNVSEKQLQWTRAAVSKTINSLTWESEIRRPQTIGPEETVMVIDLRDYGWRESDWDGLVEKYPFGLRWDAHPRDEKIAAAAEEIDRFAHTELPFIRADWFVANATNPEHYFKLLDLPATVEELERKLGVDSQRDISLARARRAGFRQSGVSRNNRLLDRHETRIGPTKRGYYWRSYDFGTSVGKNDLQQFPLGPDYARNPYRQLAFKEDGGEMVFTLPNGLQAYYLIRGNGTLLEVGPIQVVQDNDQISGTPEIVCGQSCLYCHKSGIISFVDTIRGQTTVTGDALKHVRKLYADHQEMAALIESDQRQFMTALRKAVSPFMDVPEKLDDLNEPIGKVALRYHGPSSDLSIEDVATELYVDRKQVEGLTALPHKANLLGLGAFREQGLIKRDNWEAAYQKIAVELYGIESIQPGKPRR